MAGYSFALSDDLCKEYLLFKQHSKEYDKSIVAKLLQYHTQEEFIYNTSQIARIKIDLSETLIHRLRLAKFTTQSLEELASKTTNKLILSTNNSTFPYVNIFNDNISNNIIGCFYKNADRSKAIDHIKALCFKAKKIQLYDSYLKDNLTYKVLETIIPNNTNVEINYMHEHLCDDCISDLKKTLTNCKFTKIIHNPDDHHHDRYIIIDDKIEIILTSGFKYLTETNKELSYIVRPISGSRFEL